MLKEYFSLTSSERNGLFALFMLILALILFIRVRKLSYEPEIVSLSALQDSVQCYYDSPAIEARPKKVMTSYASKYDDKGKYSKSYTSKPLVIVEINSATAKELTQIKGIGEFYAKNIVEERKRLGGFSHMDQLLAVYGMTAEKLSGIEQQITIDSTLCLSKVGLNSADSFQLAGIYVIEPYVASRIVRYRERLGGFYDSKQLLDIFCIDEELFVSMSHRLFLDTVELRLLDVNNIDFNTLMKHPYIDGYKNTKAIFRYLEYGAVSTWEEFLKIPNLQLNNSDALRHYVVFNPRVAALGEDDSTINRAE